MANSNEPAYSAVSKDGTQILYFDKDKILLRTEPVKTQPSSNSPAGTKKPSGFYKRPPEKFDWAPWGYIAGGGILSYLLASDLFDSHSKDSNFLQRIAPWVAAAAGAFGGHYLSKKADADPILEYGPLMRYSKEEGFNTNDLPTGDWWRYGGYAAEGSAVVPALWWLANNGYNNNMNAAKIIAARNAEIEFQKLKDKGATYQEAVRAARLAEDNYTKAHSLWTDSSPKSIGEEIDAQSKFNAAEQHLADVSNKRTARRSWKTSNPKSYSAYLDAIEKFKEADRASAAAGAGKNAQKLFAARNKAYEEMIRLRNAAVRDRIKYMSAMKEKAVAARDSASEALSRATEARKRDFGRFENDLKLKSEEAARKAKSLAVDGAARDNAEKAFNFARNAAGGARYDNARNKLLEVGADGKPTEAAKKLFERLQQNAAKVQPTVSGTGVGSGAKGLYRKGLNAIGKRKIPGGFKGMLATIAAQIGIGGLAKMIGSYMAEDRDTALNALKANGYVEQYQEQK